MTVLAIRIANRQERTERLFLFALGIYFIAQIAIRVAQHGALELDEAEQVFQSQELHLGYHGQPPLYVWLQWLVFKLVGINHFGLALMKNALLFGLYASVFQTARLLLGAFPGAAIASSLVLLIPLGWEAQIDRTHSTLATTLAAAALWTYLLLVRNPRMLYRVLLGLLMGLGLQSKYNFAIFALALLAASLAVPEHRKAVWTREAWATILIAAVCLLPHGLWFLQQVQEASAYTLGRMKEGGGGNYASSVLHGFVQLILGAAAFVTPLWIVLLLAYRSPRQAALSRYTPEARFFGWLYAAGAACIALLVLGGLLSNVKGRWLQPLLFSVPIAVFVFFPPKSPIVFRRLLWASCVFAAVMLLALAFRPAIQSILGKDARILQPYPELASDIRNELPDLAGIVVASVTVGGNARFFLPDTPVFLVEDACRKAPLMHGPVLVLLQDEEREALANLLAACPRFAQTEQGLARVRSSRHPGQALRFVYAILQPADRPPFPSGQKPRGLTSI